MTSNYQHLSQGQRYQIEALKTTGHKQSEIAAVIGVKKSTISRELSRNSTQSAKPPDKYKAKNAQILSAKRSYVPDSPKSTNTAIQRRIKWLLRCDWSPQQIAETCANRLLPMLSAEGIYLWIYSQNRHPIDYTAYLRRHHRKRRKRKLTNQPRTIIKNRVSIHDRPQIVAEQLRFGDVETDLVKCQNGYIVTITERKSLLNLICKIPNKEAATIQKAIIETLEPIKASIYTITSDNGTEFANHEAITKELGIPWYFADPYKSQQRGANENQNGLIRQYLKRDTDLNLYTNIQIKHIQNKLNNRPRKKNNFLSPNKILSLQCVALVT